MTSLDKKTHKSAQNTFIGQVVSDKMDKTIVIKVTRSFRHPLFHKIMKAVKKYKVHDDKGVARIGDTVECYVGRPLSKTKYLYLSRVIKSSTAVSNDTSGGE